MKLQNNVTKRTQKFMQNCLENVTKPRENLKTTTRLPCRKTAKLIEKKNCSKKHVQTFLQKCQMQILPKTITQSRKYLLTYLLAYLLLRHKLILVTTSRVKNFI